MPRSTLTDAQVTEIRALATEGVSHSELARRFGTSHQHVGRLVRDEQRAELVRMPPVDVWRVAGVASAVRGLLERAGINPEVDVWGATAVVLAEKLDQCREAVTAQSAMAAPGVAKALQDVLDEIRHVLGEGGPRFGSLRGEEAVLVARELGYPDPEAVDVPHFDVLEVLRVKRFRRLAAFGDHHAQATSGNGEEPS